MDSTTFTRLAGITLVIVATSGFMLLIRPNLRRNKDFVSLFAISTVVLSVEVLAVVVLILAIQGLDMRDF